ncbi:MAG: ATP-binding protein [candidate division Zixibacteria bacterium]
MARKYDKYELEIIVSLGALILFLISINFISGYSFEKAVRGQAVQFENSVNIAANYMKTELEKDLSRWIRSDILLLERLRDFSVVTGIKGISVTDTSGRMIALLKPLESSGAIDREFLTVKRTLKRQNGHTTAYLYINAENKTGANYRNLSRWDAAFRIVGVISALVIGFFFIRAVLIPYRKIKHEALDYNLDFIDMESGKGIEYIVDTFKDVIAELEEKKARLEVMYNNSEKRADSLARYNDYILGSISSGVVICDSTGTVTRFNRSAEDILRYFEKDCRGKQYLEIFGPDHRLTALLNDALNHGITHSRLEFEVERPDGEKLWLGCSSSMINDEKGEGMGAAILMIDLTEIRRLQELSSYSEKMASLGELSAGLAHEIRNSFAAVQGFAKLLRKRGELTDNDLKLTESILGESESAESLLSRFLDFARPLNYVPEMTNLISLVDTTVHNLTHLNIDKIRLNHRKSRNIPELPADPILLKQALNNLLLNACDAMPDGGDIIIETELSDSKNTRSEVLISVSDTGVGIGPENLDKIFQPFYTDKQNGTGLGLALVKKIVVLHEGSINVKSKPGKGTRFTVYLPINLKDKTGSPDRRNIRQTAL